MVNLENHIESFHKINLSPISDLEHNNLKIKNYKCDFCQKSFDQLANLENHIERYHKVSNNTKNTSGNFQNERNISKELSNTTPDPEINSHKNLFEDSNKESFKLNCTDMDKTEIKTPHNVVKSHNLKKHIKNAHEGEKLSCKSCDKSYTQSHNLKNHIKNVHEGTKFSCKSCDKSFTQPHNLKKHIKIVHEGIKTSLTSPIESTKVPSKNCYSYS